MIDGAATLARRLERYRAALPAVLPPAAIDARDDAGPGRDLATRLAAAVDGEVVTSAEGRIVRCESPARSIPVDRDRLATLPGQPPPDVPLVCLDTETTGLATAAGTAAFLVGIGWWEGADRYRQIQLLLPDHGEERALLTAIEAAIPADAWLVTYNGRTFDWPLLTTRYRLARRDAPAHAGHLDLLPVVRRVFRHRMTDARLRTAEAELLGLHRVGDVEGWEIPGRYHAFLRGGSAQPLADVARHNDQDVRSLAWLLAHLADRYGDPSERVEAPPGDLAGLARSFARDHRLGEALECLDAAADRPIEKTVVPNPSSAVAAQRPDDVPWWSPLRPADFGGRQGVVLSRRSRLGEKLWRHRGRPSGSPSTARIFSAGSAGTTRPARHGPRWRPGPGGSPSSPRSSSRSCGNTGCATARPRSRLSSTASRRSSDDGGSDAPNPRSRRISTAAPPASAGASARRSGRIHRADLGDLAREHGTPDALPRAPDEDRGAIRDARETRTFDRQRPRRGREAQIR